MIIADTAAQILQLRLAQSGYQTLTATSEGAGRAINEFGPDVIIFEITHKAAGVENDLLGLARRLRAEPATYALPLVFLYQEDERSIRNSALNLGADDYFALSTPPAEMLARLDALFWRTEAGRRAASVAGDRRLEIDNFMLMLDSVREDLHAGAAGTLALVYAVARREGGVLNRSARDRTLAEAHGFLKLNLRRVDAVAFYGPTTLLLYLPRIKASGAAAMLSRLRGEFMDECPDAAIAIGLASFPDDSSDVEGLIEKADAAAETARTGPAARRVVASTAKEASMAPSLATPQKPTPELPVSGDVERHTVRQSSRADDVSADVRGAGGKLKAGVSNVAAESTTVPGTGSAMRSTGTDAQHAASEAAAHERERRASGAIMPRRLLLTISDSARMVQINSLIRSAGYEARAAFDGQQALDLLRIERPDLLLIDYELHGIDGLEMLRRLRKQSGGRAVLPAVLLLPPENEKVRAEALELGARCVVSMPYDPVQLLTSLRTAGNDE